MEPRELARPALLEDNRTGLRVDMRTAKLDPDVLVVGFKEAGVVGPPDHIETVLLGLRAVRVHRRRQVVAVMIRVAVDVHLNKVAVEVAQAGLDLG